MRSCQLFGSYHEAVSFVENNKKALSDREFYCVKPVALGAEVYIRSQDDNQGDEPTEKKRYNTGVRGVISDEMPPTKHPITGEVLESKSRFRDITRAHGAVEVGNDKLSQHRFEKPKVDDPRPYMAHVYDVLARGDKID
jgi:hypothetical protein